MSSEEKGYREEIRMAEERNRRRAVEEAREKNRGQVYLKEEGRGGGRE